MCQNKFKLKLKILPNHISEVSKHLINSSDVLSTAHTEVTFKPNSFLLVKARNPCEIQYLIQEQYFTFFYFYILEYWEQRKAMNNILNSQFRLSDPTVCFTKQ